jgi:hypothetical protein
MCRKERAGERGKTSRKGVLQGASILKLIKYGNKNLRSTETNCNTCHGAGERRSRKCW